MSSDSIIDSNSSSPSLDVAMPDNSSEGAGDHASSSVLLRILDPSVYFLLWFSTNVGCALILYLFYKTSQLREVSGYLMVTITCIDMFIAQVIILPTVYSTAYGDVPWKNTILCTAQAAANMFLHNLKASVIMLCAVDRMCSITFPFKYIRYATTKLFWIEFGSICSLCLTMPILLFGALKWRAEGDPESGICWPTADENAMEFYYFFMLINEILPGAVVVISYSLIVSVVCKQRQNIFNQENEVQQANSATTQGDNNGGSTNRGSVRGGGIAGQNSRSIGMALLSHLSACKMLFLVTVLYFLSFAPIVIADHFLQNRVVLYHMCTYLAYLNITTNFPIYYRMNKTFKSAYKNHVGKRLSSLKCLPCFTSQNTNSRGEKLKDKEKKYELDC